MHFYSVTAASVLLVIGILFLRPPQGGGRTMSRLPLLLPMLLTPVVTIGGYLLLGTPDALNVAGQREQAPVSHLVAGLRTRLAENPDDKDGWLLLARSYRLLGANDKAQVAMAKAAAAEVRLMQAANTGFGGTAMRGRVSLAPELEGQVSPNDTVFIFAKESQTQRMPVAALRRSVQDLPIDFELTDAHTMVAGTRLEDFASLVVTARVSPTGRAADAASSFETWSDPVRPGNDFYVDLVINKEAGNKEINNE